jgi:hypothetical protein
VACLCLVLLDAQEWLRMYLLSATLRKIFLRIMIVPIGFLLANGDA